MEFDDFGNWLKKNGYLSAAMRLRWQLTVSRQVCQQNGETVNLANLLPDAVGENVSWTTATDILLLKTPNWVSQKGVLQRLELTTQLLLQTLNNKYYLKPQTSLNAADKGITLRWQLPEALLQQSYQEKFKVLGVNYLTYRSQTYLKILQQLNKYQWIFRYLTAATPQGTGKIHRSDFWQQQFTAKNRQIVKVPQSVTASDWQNFSFQPILSQMRVGQQIVEIVGGIETTGMELNPFYSSGVNPASLRLLKLLTAYFWSSPGVPAANIDVDLQHSNKLTRQVVLGNPFAGVPELKTAIKLLNHLADFSKIAASSQNLADDFEYWRLALVDGSQNLSGRIVRQLGNNSLKLNQLAQKNQTKMLVEWQQEKLLDHNSAELLTAAFSQGKPFQIISPAEHLVEIAGHLIGDGLLTDSTGNLGQRCWKNRQLANQLAAAAGWQVPAQWLIQNKTEFQQKYPNFAKVAVAIKGQHYTGSQVFRLPPSTKFLWQQIKQVLQNDAGCLIEQAQPGTCYRILIAGGQPLSVLERLPQQVVGDGHSTIQQLIRKKQELFRQQQRDFPFQTIESTVIDLQGQQLTTVLPRGTQLLLRFDSSYQTGEEYLEMFSEIDPSYLPVLQKLAADLQVVNGVLDVIIPNLYVKFRRHTPNQLIFLNAHQTTDLRIFKQLKIGEPRPIAKLILNQLIKK